MTEKWAWLNEDTKTFLSRGYTEHDPKERYWEIAQRAEELNGIKGFAEAFYEDIAYGDVSLSSPVIANFGAGRGLPISCNGSYLADDTEAILLKVAEIGVMTKHGAGTSAYLGDIRPRGAPISGGGVTDGPARFAELLETTINVVSQSNVRRGACAAYLPVDHPDIMEFLEFREEGSFVHRLSIGVCISDEWMESLLAGDPEKKKVWLRIIRKRFETGYPYLFFTDAANRGKPQWYKDKGYEIFASNLCSEIMLPSNPDESFVCCLASMNWLNYDRWKNSGAVGRMVQFLDAVMEEYIQKTANISSMKAAHEFAKNHRAIGIGDLGWHSYLQSKMIPFEGLEAQLLGMEIERTITEQAEAASREMAKTHGESPVTNGYGIRHATLRAVAPTTSSSFILGQVSPSIEPLSDNYFVKDLQKGKFAYRNPYLKALLAEKGKDTPEVWKDILVHGGSVQHLDFLSQREKDVFKTFGEISQKEILIQASQRQKYIDQGQSLNIMLDPDTSVKDASQLLIEAWKLGLKALYYNRGTNPAQAKVRDIFSCAACEA